MIKQPIGPVTNIGEQTPTNPFDGATVNNAVATERAAVATVNDVATEPVVASTESNVVAALWATRPEEWHYTVEGGDPVDWARRCRAANVEPLFIELSTHRLQLMCTSPTPLALERVNPLDPNSVVELSFAALGDRVVYRVVRVKREVPPTAVLPGEPVLYYEAHAVYDGAFRPDRRHASRDLYRPYGPQGARWYLTWRQPHSSGARLMLRVPDYANTQGKGSVFVKLEMEAVLLDTNPELDRDWL